jgi:hypothetical protein
MFQLFDYLFEVVVRVLTYEIRSAGNIWRSLGSARWPRVEAVVTADPVRAGLIGRAVEIVYSYRVEGELYTGLHEEPCLHGEAEYMARFVKGTKFVVRVKPGEPAISVLREVDQGARKEKAFTPI